MKLQDQRVLVTGATTGIGRETAMLFARRGATVVITGRDTERGAQTVAAIEAEGGRAEFIAADLNDIQSVRRLAEQVGEVDVLVNNAAAHHFAPTKSATSPIAEIFRADRRGLGLLRYAEHYAAIRDYLYLSRRVASIAKTRFSPPLRGRGSGGR
jgi:NAD(P)-dependent dehydrogenase (short-subunit alcohol dehydrogenase family)